MKTPPRPAIYNIQSTVGVSQLVAWSCWQFQVGFSKVVGHISAQFLHQSYRAGGQPCFRSSPRDPSDASLSAEFSRELQLRHAAATPLSALLLWRKDKRFTKVPFNPVSLVTRDVNGVLTWGFHRGDIFGFPFQAWTTYCNCFGGSLGLGSITWQIFFLIYGTNPGLVPFVCLLGFLFLFVL